MIKKELKQKLKQLEKDYNFFYELEDDFVEISNEYGGLEIYAEIDTNNEECVDELLFILNNFDFSFTLEFSDCDELKEFVEIIKRK
jgi:5-bromo-4-chloroindolyl phosphate hydrolysis protein